MNAINGQQQIKESAIHRWRSIVFENKRFIWESRYAKDWNAGIFFSLFNFYFVLFTNYIVSILNANVLKTSWEFTRYAKMIYGPLSIFTIFVPFDVSNQINLFADSNNLSWRCMFRLMETKLDPSTITWFLWRWFSLIKAFIDKFLDFDTDIRMAFFLSLFQTCIIHNGDACIVYTKRSIFWWKNFGPLWCGCLPTDSTEQILEHKTSVQLVVENSNGDIRCANTIAIVLSIHLRAACNPFHHI